MDGYKLGVWVKSCRQSQSLGMLRKTTWAQLAELGVWATSPADGRKALLLMRWEAAQLQAFVNEHGHCRVPSQRAQYKTLRTWVEQQRGVRRGRARGSLSETQAVRLEALKGWVWNPSAEKWVDRMMCSAP